MDEVAKLKFHLQNILSWAADLHVKEFEGQRYTSNAGIEDITVRRKDIIGFQEAIANARKDFPDIDEWTDIGDTG
jgi:hypothetical protein